MKFKRDVIVHDWKKWQKETRITVGIRTEHNEAVGICSHCFTHSRFLDWCGRPQRLALTGGVRRLEWNIRTATTCF